MTKTFRQRAEKIITRYQRGLRSGLVSKDYLSKDELVDKLESLHMELMEKKVEEIIELSDKIEIEGETTLEEWKAFKDFRNTVRDKYFVESKKGKKAHGKHKHNFEVVGLGIGYTFCVCPCGETKEIGIRQ